MKKLYTTLALVSYIGSFTFAQEEKKDDAKKESKKK